MMKTLSGAAALVLMGAALTACTHGRGDGPPDMMMSTSTVSPPTAQVLEDERCGANQYMNYVGQAYTAVPASVRARSRVVADNQPMTQEFNPTRLNFVYRASDNQVISVRCG